MNDLKRKLLVVFILLCIHPIHADELLVTNTLEPSQIKEIQDNTSKLLSALSDAFPEANDAKISESSIQGLYTVSIGSQIFYMSQNGQFILQGDIYNVETGANLTERDRISARKKQKKFGAVTTVRVP